MNLADLHKAVAAQIAGKRIGVPVFVRYLAQGPFKPGAAPGLLAQLTATAAAWLGQELTRIFAAGRAEDGAVSLTLQFRAGGSALVSVAPAGQVGPAVDVMVLGNHGAIYHDAGGGNPWDDIAFVLDAPPPKLVGAIERALRSGKPEVVEE